MKVRDLREDQYRLKGRSRKAKESLGEEEEEEGRGEGDSLEDGVNGVEEGEEGTEDEWIFEGKFPMDDLEG